MRLLLRGHVCSRIRTVVASVELLKRYTPRPMLKVFLIVKSPRLFFSQSRDSLQHCFEWPQSVSHIRVPDHTNCIGSVREVKLAIDKVQIWLVVSWIGEMVASVICPKQYKPRLISFWCVKILLHLFCQPLDDPQQSFGWPQGVSYLQLLLTQVNY